MALALAAAVASAVIAYEAIRYAESPPPDTGPARDAVTH